MEVQLDKRYPIDAPLDAAWAVLSDLHALAACMPGAQITESVDATHHKGTVRAKVGPATLSFQGEIEQQAPDAAAHRIALHAKGADRAGSSASMDLQAHLELSEDDEDECVLVGRATVNVAGKLAQFGNRLLMPASDAILAQFAHQFRLAARRHAGLESAGEAAHAGESTEVRMVQGAQAMGTLDAPAHDTARADTVALRLAPRTPMAPARPAAAPPPSELNLLAVLWAAVKGWFAGLFGRRR